MQHLSVQALADERTHQMARFVARFAAGVVVRREIEERPTADQQIAVRRAHGAAVGLIYIRAGGFDRGAGGGVAVEHRRIAKLGEETLLEAAQYGGKRIACRESGE